MGYLDTEYHITLKGTNLLTEVNKLFKPSAKNSKLIDSPEFMEKVKIYRDLFPNCRAGGGKPARSKAEILAARFKKFFEVYPEYIDKWNYILEATRRYVLSYEDKGYEYMRTSKYFIFRDKDESDLADEIEKLNDDLTNPEPEVFQIYKIHN